MGGTNVKSRKGALNEYKPFVGARFPASPPLLALSCKSVASVKRQLQLSMPATAQTKLSQTRRIQLHSTASRSAEHSEWTQPASHISVRQQCSDFISSHRGTPADKPESNKTVCLWEGCSPAITVTHVLQCARKP